MKSSVRVGGSIVTTFTEFCEKEGDVALIVGVGAILKPKTTKRAGNEAKEDPRWVGAIRGNVQMQV